MITNEVKPTTRALLESAVQKLGPIRSRDALLAFEDEDAVECWDACGLALAYGAPGELAAAIGYKRGYLSGFNEYKRVAPLVGLSKEETEAFALGFDGWDGAFAVSRGVRPLLRSLLEAEAAKIRTAPVSAPETVSAGA